MFGAKGSNSITPRGDGNIPNIFFYVPPLVVQIPLPREGTETSLALGSRLDLRFKFHYPARGRKPERYQSHWCRRRLFKFHYPARGRKHVGSGKFCPGAQGFKFHYPARGRKPRRAFVCCCCTIEGSNSITPRGEGNGQDDGW